MFRDYWPVLALTVAGAVVLGGLALAIIAETRACTALGGRIVTKTSLGVGVTGNGGVAVTPVAISFCISPDGRILGE